jgi:hypothetical protein
MANIIGPWVYRGDDGRDYITGVDTEVSAQQHGGDPNGPKIGGRAATSNDAFPPLPSSVRPRRVYAKNPAGKGRYVTVMSPDAWLYEATGRVITLEDSDGVGTVFTTRKFVPETFGRSRV